ncbi:MAG: hypothetical protein GW942_00885 [Candidatus Pacebacteria bacterium]|nr:hypothetical protein [Candidatus Paceibacterota bacterium]
MSISEKANIFASNYCDVKYRYEVGPVSELAPNWFVEGINCQLLIHLVYKEFFEVTLPQYLRSSEMYADNSWFIDKPLNNIEEGDILFMGPRFLSPRRDPNDEDAKKLHIAMVTSVGPDDEIEIIHARARFGIIVDPLETAQSLRRGSRKPYEKIFAVKRLKI